MTTAALGFTASAAAAQRLAPRMEQRSIGTPDLLQAVSIVDDQTVWLSGHSGTFARTTDGGRTWAVNTVPNADSLEFRDVHALSADIAWLMSAGPGDRSRIYHTVDGGQNWSLQFQSDIADAFFDCFAFWDARHGVAFSDAVEGRFIIMRTTDGRTWRRVSDANVPRALAGEGSFAASGTCVTTVGTRHGWIGTGSGSVARVLRTADRGGTWQVSDTPVIAGPSAGIASVAFADTLLGWAFGGTIGATEAIGNHVARTWDGGATWELMTSPPFPGPIYGSAIVPGAPDVAVAVSGPGGVAYTIDGGMSWRVLDTQSFWAIGFGSPSEGWAVGPAGRLAHVSMYR
jgi:photosystem II stability/assembly factor-like uncharacterized protein